MNSGSQGLSFHQDMALVQMCAGKEELFSLPMWKEKLTSVKSTPSKGENRQAKRKLYSPDSASEDEDKKNVSLKRRRNSPVGDLSPSIGSGLNIKSRTLSSLQRLTTVPLSERQQMALLMRQITDETTHHTTIESVPHCVLPNSPYSKKTPTSDHKSYKRNSRGETPLHTAAIKGDVKTVKKLIESGIDVNIKDYAGWTALHEACNYGRIDVAKCLLKAGANVNVQGLDNDLPLHDAARNGHLKIVELLLRHGADPLLQNLKGKSSLDVAQGDDIKKLMNSEVIASGSSCSSMSVADMRSPASTESFHMDQEDDRFLVKKESIQLQATTSNPLVNHWDKFCSTDIPGISYSLNTSHHHLIYPPVLSQSIRAVVPSTCQHLNLPNWNYALNQSLCSSKRNYDSTDYSENRNLSSHRSLPFFTLADNPIKHQEINIINNDICKDVKMQVNKNMILHNSTPCNNWKSISSSECIKDNKNHSNEIELNFQKTATASTLPLGAFDSSNIKSESNNLVRASTAANQSEDSNTFMNQFEDISDAEDEEVKVEDDAAAKLKNNFLASNFQHIISPNISSNIYRPNTPLYYNASISNSNAMSQFPLLPNFQWSNLAYGCFPVIANSTSPSHLSLTNIALPTSNLPGLPTAATTWRSLSPGQSSISSLPLDTFVQKSFSPDTSGDITNCQPELLHNQHLKHHQTQPQQRTHYQQQQRQTPNLITEESLRLPQPAIKSNGMSIRHQEVTIVNNETRFKIETSDPSLLAQDIDAPEGMWQQFSANKISPGSCATEKQENNEWLHSTPTTTCPLQVFSRATDLKTTTTSETAELALPNDSKEVESVCTVECCVKNIGELKSTDVCSFNMTSSIGVAFSCSVFPTMTSISSDCAVTACKNVVVSVCSNSISSNDLTKAPSEGNISRVSSPADSLDGGSSCLKVPPIKIVLPSKAAESCGEKVLPVHKPNMPYIVNITAANNVTSADMLPSLTCIAAKDSAESHFFCKMDQQSISNSQETSECAPAKKRKTKHAYKPCSGKEGEGEKEIVIESSSSFSKLFKESPTSTINSTFPLINEESHSKICNTLDESSSMNLRQATERRVTRSTTANKQQKIGSQKESKSQLCHDAAAPRNEINNLIGPSSLSSSSSTSIRQDISADVATQPQLCKDEEDAQIGQSVGRKQKAKGQKVSHESSGPADGVLPIIPPQVFKKPANPFGVYFHFKKEVAERRNKLSTIYPKPPPRFNEYLIVKGTYRLDPSAQRGVREPLPILPVPSSLPEPLKKLFEEQEKIRSHMRHEHLKEKERLSMMAEQETLRIHGRAARASAGQGAALSVCTVMCSEDLCYPLECEHEDGRDTRTRYNGRLFNGWLQDITDKYSKLKSELLARHHHEATVLYGMQKLSWEWKLKELGLCDCHTAPSVEASHIPSVSVDDHLILNIS